MALGDTWNILRNSGDAAEVARGLTRSANLGRWVAVYDNAAGTRRIFTAEDSNIFSWASQTTAGTDIYRDVGSDDAGQFVICGANGIIVYSTDGLSWAAQNVFNNPNMRRIAFGGTSLPGNLFLASGVDIVENQVVVGVDNWAAVDNQTNDWYGIGVDSSDLWVVSGETGGVGQFSYRAGGIGGFPNGYDTVKYTVAGSSRRIQVTAGNGVWVSVGVGGEIWTASDPTTGSGAWTSRTSGTAQDLHDVVNTSGGIWFACGDAGTVLKSVDNGVTWTALAPPVNVDLRRMSYNSATSQLLINGNSGVVLMTDSSAAPIPATPPSVTETVPEKTNYVSEAIGRLAVQFRS